MQGEDAILKVHSGESPGGLAVRIWCFHCCGPSSTPGLQLRSQSHARQTKKSHLQMYEAKQIILDILSTLHFPYPINLPNLMFFLPCLS